MSTQSLFGILGLTISNWWYTNIPFEWRVRLIPISFLLGVLAAGGVAQLHLHTEWQEPFIQILTSTTVQIFFGIIVIYIALHSQSRAQYIQLSLDINRLYTVATDTYDEVNDGVERRARLIAGMSELKRDIHIIKHSMARSHEDIKNYIEETLVQKIIIGSENMGHLTTTLQDFIDNDFFNLKINIDTLQPFIATELRSLDHDLTSLFVDGGNISDAKVAESFKDLRKHLFGIQGRVIKSLGLTFMDSFMILARELEEQKTWGHANLVEEVKESIGKLKAEIEGLKDHNNLTIGAETLVEAEDEAWGQEGDM
jgi:hypothetical protein